MKPAKSRTPLLSEEPFLFYQDQPDWRWLSFAEAGQRLERWRSLLAALPPRSRVGIPGSPSVAALLADVATRSCGLTAVALPAVSKPGLDPLTVEVDTVLPFEAPGIAVDGTRSVPTEERRQPAGGSGVQSPGDCVVTTAEGGTASSSRFSASELEAGVARLIEVSRRTDSDQREIVVHGRSLAEIGERIVIEWAIRTAAAIAVAPSPAALAETIFWVRPSVLHGSAELLAAWPRLFSAAESRQRGLRARFRRLRLVIVCGGEPLDRESATFYAGLGAELAELEAR